VTDKNKAFVSGATVTVRNKGTDLTRTATTNESGNYRIEQLPAGMYEIKVTAPNFVTVTADNFELLVGRTSTFDVTLQPGLATETVNVTSEVPIIDQTKTDVGLNITPREVENLPLNGRDFANLAILAPGAKPVNSYDPTKNRIAVFGINGSSGRNVNVTVNGVDNKDNTVGGPVMQLPLEAVQEFRISTQRFSAANGRSEGAAVEVVTKSGANQFHGSGYVFERDRRFNALNYFEKTENGGTGQKSPFQRQQFGGSIGGPIIRDKAFFFFALERQRELTSITVNGDAFNELSLVTSLGAKPASTIPTPYRDWRYNARIDYRFNDRHNAYISFSDQSNRGENDQSTATNDLTEGNFTTNSLQIANFTLNSILSPKTVNSFTFGYQFWNNLIDSTIRAPYVTFPGGISFGTNPNVPQQSYQRKFQFKDDISITQGNHTIRTSVDYVYEPRLGGFFEFNPTPEFDFLDKPSVILSNKTKYPQGFATPGAVIGIAATAGDPYFNLPGGAKMLGLYIQDDWKARPNLTLNIGLRYDKDFNLIGTKSQAQNRTYLALKAINSPYAASLPHDDNRGFSPRVGFAYDVRGNGKHIIRGGYGLYFGQTFLNIPLFMIQQTNATLFATVFSISSSGPGDPNADIVPGTNIKLSNYRYGVDPLPTIPPASSQLQAGSVGRLMDPNYRNP
jgi:outer membrane receptor protein involved in Fe transport